MSNEYKDRLAYKKAMTAAEVLEDQGISDWATSDNPYERLQEIISYNCSISVYFAFEKLWDKIHNLDLSDNNSHDIEKILQAIKETSDEETKYGNKVASQEAPKRHGLEEY